MRSGLKTAFILLVIFFFSTVFLALLYRPSESPPFPEAPRVYVDMTISLSKLLPDLIEVEQGTHVFLNITSMDVEHRFALTYYLTTVRVPAEEAVVVEFLANLPGTFAFQCTVVAPGHQTERGNLVVTAQ
ncbi:MAG: hypothetical protein ACE5HJ_01255 [Thermoplasmata archaeon]